MRTDKIKRLLESLKEIPDTDKERMTSEEFGKWVYSTEIGKEVIDELRKGKVNAKELQHKGFIAAEISLGWILAKR